MSKELILVVLVLTSLLFGLHIAESDIKRDCDRLGHVVLFNVSYVCEVSK